MNGRDQNYSMIKTEADEIDQMLGIVEETGQLLKN